MPTQKITVREIGPGNFAVIGANGQVIRDGFPIAKCAWMFAGRAGLHKSPRANKHRATEVPDDLIGERILGLPLAAKLSHIPYGRFLPRARAGEFGPLIQINERHFGLRFRDWRAAIDARVVK